MTEEILSILNIHKLTQEQYNRELENGNIDENAIYLTPDINTQELITKITENTKHTQVPSAKAVYDFVQEALYIDEGATVWVKLVIPS